MTNEIYLNSQSFSVHIETILRYLIPVRYNTIALCSYHIRQRPYTNSRYITVIYKTKASQCYQLLTCQSYGSLPPTFPIPEGLRTLILSFSHYCALVDYTKRNMTCSPSVHVCPLQVSATVSIFTYQTHNICK